MSKLRAATFLLESHQVTDSTAETRTTGAVVAVGALRLDDQGRLLDEMSCRKCGYTLRGLRLEGVCPECATPVGRSVRGDLLRYSDPEWVESLARGMNWIVFGIVAGVVMGCVGGGFAGAMGGAVGPAGLLIMLGVSLGVSMVRLYGYWTLTTPDPAIVEPESGLTVRGYIRFAQVVDCISVILQQVVMGFLPTLLAFVLFTATQLISVAGSWCVCIYARRLALRIPEEPLARSTRTVMWGFGITLLVVVVGGGAMAILNTVGPAAASAPALATTYSVGPATLGMGPGASAFFAASCFVMALFVVFAIWSLRLIDRYRKAFHQAAADARATWAAPVAGGN